MRFDVLTLFPEMFEGPMGASMMGLARERGLIEFHSHDIREWAHDKHRSTDDYSYGGGQGMLMKPGPVFESVEAVREMSDLAPTVIFFTPAGRRLDQALVQELATHERLVLVCGRYEGFDERVFELADMQLSIGDYVLTGGELPAMVTIDAVARQLPGVLGHEDSAVDETFTQNLLEYPQYTRPSVYRDLVVPEVLLSGDHARIDRWRREQAIRKTARLRPDLLETAQLSESERAMVAEELSADDTSSLT